MPSLVLVVSVYVFVYVCMYMCPHVGTTLCIVFFYPFSLYFVKQASSGFKFHELEVHGLANKQQGYSYPWFPSTGIIGKCFHTRI